VARRIVAGSAGHAAQAELHSGPDPEPERAVPPTTPAPAGSADAVPPHPGRIGVEFAGGKRVRVEETVSLAALRQVIPALRG
jgi:hypothetical protein